MIRRLQVRFVCITMSIVLVMLCAIFWMVSAMTRRNMEKASLEFLYAAAADPDRRFERVDREDAPQFPYFVLDRLADGTVELAQSDTGLPGQQMEPVDLSRTMEMCALTFEPVLFERRHTLLCQIAPGLYVRGSRGRLEQLISILLDNANKYASPGSQVRLTLRRLDKGRCLLEVFSQGEPLTREQCRKVFQRFYRADPARSAEGGFGLGLSIAAGIVRQHGGSIWARPEADGNTFAVRLRTLRRPAAP